jgi:hypothetical protein
MNEAYHAARGASGQGRDDANETMSYARMARAGQAPAATPYSTTGTAAGEGGHTGASGLNRRNGMIEAKSADPAQNFVIENPSESFASDPVKPRQAAINALNNDARRIEIGARK